jgi:hypothetical protein
MLVICEPTLHDPCGFFQVHLNGSIRRIPYTVKDGVKYLPLFYFNGSTGRISSNPTTMTKCWELNYLKFCCNVDGVREEYYLKEALEVVSFEKVKECLAPNVIFEEYWPIDNRFVRRPRHHSWVNAFYAVS